MAKSKEFRLPKAQPIESVLINAARTNGGKVGLSEALLTGMKWPRVVPGKNGKKKHAKWCYADGTPQEREMAERSTKNWISSKAAPSGGLGPFRVLKAPKATVHAFLPLAPGLEPDVVEPQSALVVRENYVQAHTDGYFGIIIGKTELLTEEISAYSAITSKRFQVGINNQTLRMFELYKIGKLPDDWEAQAYAPELRLLIEKHGSTGRLTEGSK
jgi:hypothetical protein